jgi:hypothetical protein
MVNLDTRGRWKWLKVGLHAARGQHRNEHESDVTHRPNETQAQRPRAGARVAAHLRL